MSDTTTTLVSEGERTVVGIELPKGKPQSPTRKVSFEIQGQEKFSPAGWIYADQLGAIAIGDRVAYRIEKNADGFNTLTHIAPVSNRDQMPVSAAPPKSGHDDASGGDGSRPSSPEREVPNTDTGRFESWAFVANVGTVDLAYEELSDALEAGEIDSITPEMLKRVAEHLLNAADQAQRSLVGHADRGAQSHTRARGAVRTALRKYPVRVVWSGPGNDIESMDAWAAEVTKTATRLLMLAAAL